MAALFPLSSARPGVKGLIQVLVGLLLLLLPGCLGSQAPTMIRQWVLEYDTPAISGCSPLPAVIELERFSTAWAFNSQEMVYQPQAQERGVYPYNRWRKNPGDMVGDLLVRDLRRSGLFKAVLSPSQAGGARFRLEGGVERFLEMDQAQGWRAELRLVLTLMDLNQKNLPDRVILQKEYQADAPIQPKGAAGLARAMSRALAQVSGQALADICQSAGKALEKTKGQ
jgi:ABC-type uncharacterized transport system auxiliary subunit